MKDDGAMVPFQFNNLGEDHGITDEPSEQDYDWQRETMGKAI